MHAPAMRCGGKQFLSPGNMAAKNKAVLDGEFIMGKSSSRFLRSGSAAALALYAASALVFGLAVSAPAAEPEIRRASGRERVGEYELIPVVRRSLQQKQKYYAQQQ